MSCIEHTQGGRAAVYGTVQYDGKTVLRHRLAYVQHHGLTLEDINGKVVRHTCDNPRCYNHEHLLLGSHSDNMKDMWERGRGTNLPPVITGESHPQAKLSDNDVHKMRELYSGGAKRKELQMLFNVSKSAVQRIVTMAAR